MSKFHRLSNDTTNVVENFISKIHLREKVELAQKRIISTQGICCRYEEYIRSILRVSVIPVTSK